MHYTPSITRRAMLAGIFATGVAACATRGTSRGPGPILFVCRYGSVKSPVAREIMRREAARQGVTVTAFSRGITPEEHLPDDLYRSLLASGIDTRRDGLRGLTQEDLDAAALVVIFDDLPDGFRADRMVNWTDLPSMLADPQGTGQELEQRIRQLLQSLPR